LSRRCNHDEKYPDGQAFWGSPLTCFDRKVSSNSHSQLADAKDFSSIIFKNQSISEREIWEDQIETQR